MKTILISLGLIFTLSLMSCATRTVVETPRYTTVKVAPKHHKVVVVKGKRYYFWNGRYYKKTRRGYVFVRV